MSTTVAQYRVVGQPNPARDPETGEVLFEFPVYDFIWTDPLAEHHGYESGKQAALDYRDRIGELWTVPPVVQVRTVTMSDWEVVQ